ncbi:hypothetical protein ACFQ1L_06990 [Phytohabitans flavus]|uniref:hypothetical protein n=1 Tax=Phytohabitans flavus TaxID=1076124 RepID=UPI0036402063
MLAFHAGLYGVPRRGHHTSKPARSAPEAPRSMTTPCPTKLTGSPSAGAEAWVASLSVPWSTIALNSRALSRQATRRPSGASTTASTAWSTWTEEPSDATYQSVEPPDGGTPTTSQPLVAWCVCVTVPTWGSVIAVPVVVRNWLATTRSTGTSVADILSRPMVPFGTGTAVVGSIAGSDWTISGAARRPRRAPRSAGCRG